MRNVPYSRAVEPLPSLFVVSLPRSYSGLVHAAGRAALGLREPRWTTDGEVLNVDRLAQLRGPRHGSTAAFTTRDQDGDLFERLLEFLAQVVQLAGFAYKDVIQPFVIAAWLPQTSLRVVKVVRPVADVAYAMLNRGWHYPRAAATAGLHVDAAVIEGLLRAEEALAGIPGSTVMYDDFVTSEEPLAHAFAVLYPEAEVAPLRYLDERFAQERARQFARRATPRYKALAALVEEMRGRVTLT